MGSTQSSTSKVANVSNQLYVNKSTIDQVNQQLNTVIANTIVKNAMESGGSIINQQELSFTGLSAQGDVDIGGISQKQVAALTFSTMNQTQARNDAALSFIQSALDSLKNNVSADILNQMEANADSSVQSGFLSQMPVSTTKSSSEVTNSSNLSVVTENVRNINNVLQNRVENNFVTETVTSCLAKINNSQIFRVQDVTSSNGNIRILNVTQDQAATAISQCGSVVDATNKIINDTLNALDIKVDDTNTVVAKTDQTGTTTSKTESSGIFESLSKIFSLDSLVGLLLLGIVGFIVFIIIIVVIFKLM
jgi:CRISPR/Cas system-associated protein endoribonuclease Cas2